MKMSRRQLAGAGAVALGVSGLLRDATAFAEAADDAAVSRAVEVYRKALMEKDKSRLEQLAAEQLSYGHSDGRVQDKAQFIDGVMTRKATVKSLTFPELTVAVAGNAAVVRHLYESESETDGKTSTVKIGTLQVWQKQGRNWKLLARQGYSWHSAPVQPPP